MPRVDKQHQTKSDWNNIIYTQHLPTNGANEMHLKKEGFATKPVGLGPKVTSYTIQNGIWKPRNKQNFKREQVLHSEIFSFTFHKLRSLCASSIFSVPHLLLLLLQSI
jgi:hypothetical protein